MAFANKLMVNEWARNNPTRLVDLIEANITQELQTALENLVLSEYRTPAALRATYTAALDILKASGDTTAMSYLQGKLAELG